jgi:hypothetical protein
MCLQTLFPYDDYLKYILCLQVEQLVTFFLKFITLFYCLVVIVRILIVCIFAN